MTRMLIGACLGTLLSTFNAFSAEKAGMDGKYSKDEGAVKEISFFLFTDTQIAFSHRFTTAEPGIQSQDANGRFRSQDIPKNVLSITHADAWAYGTNFFSLDVLKSGSRDPAGTTNAPGGYDLFGYGATEAYGLYRGTLSLNEILGTKMFKVPGLIKDVSLSFGFDANAKNNPYGPRKRAIVGGLSFSFDVPAGFLSAGVHAYKEWGRNGFNVQPDREMSFDTVPEFEVVFNFPLLFTDLPLSLAGFNNVTLPKGRGVTNVLVFDKNPKTGVEFLSRTNIVLDVGKLIWNQPNKLDIFLGFQYWKNKFGVIERFDFKGSVEKSLLAGVSVHIF